MAAKIPATVVTGFLGAGKTSLIRNLLADSGGARIAVIVNEFGEVGVDGGLLEDCGDPQCTGDVVELANGCICCTVADEFLPAMETLLGRADAPDHIVVENLGPGAAQAAGARVRLARGAHPGDRRRRGDGARLARPRRRPVCLRTSRRSRRSGPRTTRSTTTALSTNCSRTSSPPPDMVLLNKTDLVDADELAALEATVGGRLRPGVKLVRGTHGTVPRAVLLGLDAAAAETIWRGGHRTTTTPASTTTTTSPPFHLDLPDPAGAGAADRAPARTSPGRTTFCGSRAWSPSRGATCAW